MVKPLSQAVPLKVPVAQRKLLQPRVGRNLQRAWELGGGLESRTANSFWRFSLQAVQSWILSSLFFRKLKGS